jgi:GxxExxY protein
MNTDGEEPLYKAESQPIVVDTKVIEKITDREIGQMMNYLKVTGLRLGYILNFKRAKLEWKRVVR